MQKKTTEFPGKKGFVHALVTLMYYDDQCNEMASTNWSVQKVTVDMGQTKKAMTYYFSFD